jgi:hypothetical protein
MAFSILTDRTMSYRNVEKTALLSSLSHQILAHALSSLGPGALQPLSGSPTLE